ncbi:MAG: MgtC/SapB family protein [Nostoc sp.]|uniref:MgtC/SapB family protein n=1 Tax=Nostoc sp. TaxID=1180 RepID=UPI002FF45441
MSNTYYLATNDWLNISLRLCIALAIGAIIGLERQISRKPAGLTITPYIPPLNLYPAQWRDIRWAIRN